VRVILVAHRSSGYGCPSCCVAEDVEIPVAEKPMACLEKLCFYVFQVSYKNWERCTGVGS